MFRFSKADSKPNCEIKFPNDKSSFWTNEKLSGVVILNNEKAKSVCTKIELEFAGNAKVKFWVQDLENPKNSLPYRGEQNIISETLNLWTSDGESGWPEGIQKFGFSFFIPFELPSSLEADHYEFINTTNTNEEVMFHFKSFGHIRYKLIVKLIKDEKVEFSYEFPIQITKNYDLNPSKETIMAPLKFFDYKKFKFSSKQCFMTVQLPHSGFACGQEAKFAILIENDSSVDVKAIQIDLLKVFLYTSSEPRANKQIAKKCIETKMFEGVPGRTSKDIEAVIKVPNVEPTSEGLCRLLELSYEFQVTAKFKGLHTSLSLKLPVVIGTVPLFFEDNHSPTYNLNENFGASTSSMNETSHDIAPPSYNEAIHEILQNHRDEASSSKNT